MASLRQPSFDRPNRPQAAVSSPHRPRTIAPYESPGVSTVSTGDCTARVQPSKCTRESYDGFVSQNGLLDHQQHLIRESLASGHYSIVDWFKSALDYPLYLKKDSKKTSPFTSCRYHSDTKRYHWWQELIEAPLKASA